MRPIRIGPALWALALALALAGPGGAAEKPPLRLGLVGTAYRHIPPRMLPALAKPFTDMVQQQTGRPAQLSLTADAETLAQQLFAKKLDVGVFQGFEFAWVQPLHPELTPLAVAMTGISKNHASLVVHQESPIAGFADLREKKLTLAKNSREHNRLFLERGCLACGAEPKRLLAEIVPAAHTEDALDDVVDGVADATVVDTASLDLFRDRKPSRCAKLKVVAQSERFPSGVIVFAKGEMAEATQQRLRQALLQANKTIEGRNLLMLMGLSGFEALPADYEQQLAAVRKAYPAPAPARP